MLSCIAMLLNTKHQTVQLVSEFEVKKSNIWQSWVPSNQVPVLKISYSNDSNIMFDPSTYAKNLEVRRSIVYLLKFAIFCEVFLDQEIIRRRYGLRLFFFKTNIFSSIAEANLKLQYISKYTRYRGKCYDCKVRGKEFHFLVFSQLFQLHGYINLQVNF